MEGTWRTVNNEIPLSPPKLAPEEGQALQKHRTFFTLGSSGKVLGMMEGVSLVVHALPVGTAREKRSRGQAYCWNWAFYTANAWARKNAQPSPLLRHPVAGRPKCCHSILCTSLYKEESESGSHLVVSNSLQLHRLYSPWNSLGQHAGLSSLSLLQGIFPTQGLNPGILHCRQFLYQLSYKGSPRILEWVTYPFSSGSTQPRNWTGVSCIVGGFFTNWAIREALFFKQSFP